MKKGKGSSERNIEIKATLTSVTRLMLISGLIIFLVTYFIGTTDLEGHPVISAFRDAARNIGLTLFSAGLISALVEMSTITSVVQTALEKLVVGDFPFDKFSTERLKELSKQIAVKRTTKENFKISQLDKTIYLLEPKLLNDSVGIYYEYHKDTTIIRPDEANSMFKKWVSIEYKLINRFKEPHTIKFCISLINNSEKLTDNDIKEKFNLENLEILCSTEVESNENKLKNKLLNQNLKDLIRVEPIEKKPHTTYKYQITIECPIENAATCLVKMACSYDVPMSDPIQSFKLNHPCKEFEHTITIDNNNWEIAADAYTAFFFTDENKEYQVRQNVASSVTIAFKNWAVTGAGYMALLFKNKQDSL